MNCPKCQADMEKVSYHKIEVDRCVGCQGIWFDMLENEHLREIEGAERLDIGDAAKGRKFDEIGKVDCPVCKTRMIRMLDDAHGHQVWYESCQRCFGAFFDAGEFKEYLKEDENSVANLFRRLFARKSN